MFRDPFAKPKRKRTLTAADKKAIAAKQGWKCRRCKKALPARFHVDHIKPFSEGGSDKPGNLQALCGTCHDMKTEEDRHKKKQKKIRDKEKASDNIWGGSLTGGTTSRKRVPSFDIGLGPKPRGRKKSRGPKPVFDIGLGPKKKGKKKKNIWEL